jgi:hypothetical protein
MFSATLPHSVHAIRDVKNNRNTQSYVFHERYCMHPNDAEQLELTVVQQVQVVGYTPQSEFFVPVVDHFHDDCVVNECSQKDLSE